MNDYGIKVSQVGHDVKTAAKERLIFSSKYDTFKVFATGNGSVTVPVSSTSIVEVMHGLGYKPAFWVFADNPQFYNAGELSPYSYKSIGVPSYSGFDWACDTTKLYLYFNNSSPAVTLTSEYRYYIFYNELA